MFETAAIHHAPSKIAPLSKRYASLEFAQCHRKLLLQLHRQTRKWWTPFAAKQHLGKMGEILVLNLIRSSALLGTSVEDVIRITSFQALHKMFSPTPYVIRNAEIPRLLFQRKSCWDALLRKSCDRHRHQQSFGFLMTSFVKFVFIT